MGFVEVGERGYQLYNAIWRPYSVSKFVSMMLVK
jgi:hypothetical protein